MQNTLETVLTIYKTKHPQASAIFWAGSVAKNKQVTASSDLDLVIVYKELANPYRQAFIFEQWPVDTFVMDEKALLNFFEINKQKGTPGLLSMVAEGIEIPATSDFSKRLKEVAQNKLAEGPNKLTKEEIASSRFLLTDVLEDIACPANEQEQLSAVMFLHEKLATFYLRSNNQWSAQGKVLIRRLHMYNNQMAQKFYQSFDLFFKTNDPQMIFKLADEILTPFGGRLWDGFYAESER
jgi:hypothetical protein